MKQVDAQALTRDCACVFSSFPLSFVATRKTLSFRVFAPSVLSGVPRVTDMKNMRARDYRVVWHRRNAAVWMVRAKRNICHRVPRRLS
jgi:hypothetical protein